MTIRPLLTAGCLATIGLGLYSSPDRVSERVRTFGTDLMRPGLQAVRLAVSSFVPQQFASRVNDDVATVEQLEEELARERERNRALQIRLAQLIERDLPEQEISDAMPKSQRLVSPSLIDVAVLADSLADDWYSGKLLDQGAKSGLRESEVILSSRKSNKPLIDLGDDAEISTEDALLLGRCVIGKVEHVGRWTSTFQLVTNSQYVGRAQLIRETSEGYIFEAQGILKGQGGSLCKLEGVSAENSVQIHDAVYTAERDGILPVPLYYGEVVEATLGPNDREWTVLVKPVPLPSRLTKVQVLRTAINPERLAVK